MPPCSGRAKPVDTVRSLGGRVPALTVVPLSRTANPAAPASPSHPPHWYAKIDSLYDYLVLKAPRNHARFKLFAAASLVPADVGLAIKLSQRSPEFMGNFVAHKRTYSAVISIGCKVV